MPGVNKVTLMGLVGDTPEFRSTPDGKYTCYLLLVTTARVSDSMGAWTTVSQRHRVVLFGDLAMQAHMSLKRGDQAHIEGSIRTRKWVDKVTNDVIYSSEVISESLEIIGIQDKPSLGIHARHKLHGQFNDMVQPYSSVDADGSVEQSDTEDEAAIEAMLKTGAMAWKGIDNSGRWIADFRF